MSITVKGGRTSTPGNPVAAPYVAAGPGKAQYLVIPASSASVKSEAKPDSATPPLPPGMPSPPPAPPLPSPVPPTVSSRVVTSFLALKDKNRELSSQLIEWSASIESLNESLTRLGLNVSGWARISGGEDEDNDFWTRDLGWAKQAGRWQLCLRKTAGNYRDPDDTSEEVWAFEDAPKWLQMDGIAKVSDLLDVLIKRTDEMSARVFKRTADAWEIVEALKEAVDSQVVA